MATLQLVLVMIGRLAAALGFAMVYLYTSELFPTVIRNTAIGRVSHYCFNLQIGRWVAVKM